MKSLQKLSDRVGRAEAELRGAIAARWPAGTVIHFTLSCRQKNWTTGTVLNHWGDGTMRVRLNTLNRRGNPTVKSVHWETVSR